MKEVREHLISTVIPVYNRPQMLREAVESVLAQTYRPIEIIISDDGSTDDTPQVIRELIGQYPQEIRAVNNENQGAGLAREAGRLLARGEFVQYLDSDDRLLPRKFEEQVQALREHPECGVAYGRTRLISAERKKMVEPFKWTGGGISTLFPRLLVDRWWCTHTPLYRRSVCEAVGPWTDLRYSQDWEYDGRVGALGTKLTFVDEIVSEHRQHAGNRQTGHGGWLEPKDRVRFFSSLYDSAVQAGVSHDSPEMEHFSRWVFTHTRQCGAMGDARAAMECFKIAKMAAGTPQKDMYLYKQLARIVGWVAIGKLFVWRDRVLKKRTGTQTMKQSWM